MDDFFSIEILRLFLTLVILGLTVYGYISEKYAPDVTSLLAMLALLLTGILTPEEAFGGFSHPATISVAAVIVLSAGIEKTGVVTFIARRILAPIAKSELILTAVLMIVIGSLSAFINNTAAVAIFIPVIMDVCRRTGNSPGRTLMPMSHAATFGGMITLIGTSTNLVAHEFARKSGLTGFSMFELGKVGLPMFIAGTLYILIIGRWFLPRNTMDDSTLLGQGDLYLSELMVLPGSSVIGQVIDAGKIKRDFEIELVRVIRGGKVVHPGLEKAVFEVQDILQVRGGLEKILEFTDQSRLLVHRTEGHDRVSLLGGPASHVSQAGGKSATPLAEVVVLRASGLIGRTIKGARFAERYGSLVIAIKSQGDVSDRLSTTPLHAGDVLVVEGSEESLRLIRDTSGFLVIGTPERPELRPGKMVLTITILATVIALVTFGILPIVTAAVAGSAAMILTGCLKPREVYQAIDLSLVFLLAGTLALGMALEKTGFTKNLAESMAGLTGYASPFTILVCFFVASVFISEFMSNSGTVALLAPVALSSAVHMGINPMALIAAITFGSSAAFAMPVGYQTSLMIYGPGGYKFMDFIRMGIALDIILAAIALFLIPRYWPLVLPH